MCFPFHRFQHSCLAFIQAQLATWTRIPTSSTRCSAMAVERAPGSAGWAAKRKIHCSARSLVRESFCAQCCHDRRGLSKRGTESYIHLERATVRLSRTECQYTIHESCSWGHAVSIVFSIVILALISFAKSAPRYMPLRRD